jgi:hypothetical protein
MKKSRGLRRTVFVALLLTWTYCHGQQPARQMAWWGIYVEHFHGEHLGVWLDVQARYEHTDGDWYQRLARAGIVYKLKNEIQLSGGVAYFAHYPNPNGKHFRPEWRPWQEIGYRRQRGRHTFYPRVRLEQRFFKEYEGDHLADTFHFSAFRSRARFDYAFRISAAEKTNGWSAVAGTEILLATPSIGYTALDQLRAAGGAQYAFNRHISVQLVYLWILQQKSRADREQQHIGRITLQLKL